MSPRESSVKDRAVAKLRGLGWWATRIAASPFQKAGLPDVLVALRVPPGRGLWLEFKLPGEYPSRLQLAVHEQLRRAGFRVAVVHSPEEALEACRHQESVAGSLGRYESSRELG